MANGILVSIAMLTLFQASQGTPQQQRSQQPCAVDRTLTSEQKARRTEGVNLARKIITLQVNQPGVRERKYLPQQELALQPPSGWEVRLDVTSAGYWFMVTDKTDPCGLAFVSNQEGLIFEARPLR